MNINQREEIGWRLITPPTSDAVSLEEAKEWLKIDYDAEDATIALIVQAAIGYIEDRGFALCPQTWEMLLDCFPWARACEPITIWKRPLIDLEFIKYMDADGTLQTWDSSAYQVALAGTYPRILPIYGGSWPAARAQMEAITIRFSAGYNNSPASIPATLIAAMKLLVGHLYANREAVVIMQGVVSLELPIGVTDLIDSVIGNTRVY